MLNVKAMCSHIYESSWKIKFKIPKEHFALFSNLINLNQHQFKIEVTQNDLNVQLVNIYMASYK
jgi:hypothetical protein